MNLARPTSINPRSLLPPRPGMNPWAGRQDAGVDEPPPRQVSAYESVPETGVGKVDLRVPASAGVPAPGRFEQAAQRGHGEPVSCRTLSACWSTPILTFVPYRLPRTAGPRGAARRAASDGSVPGRQSLYGHDRFPSSVRRAKVLRDQSPAQTAAEVRRRRPCAVGKARRRSTRGDRAGIARRSGQPVPVGIKFAAVGIGDENRKLNVKEPVATPKRRTSGVVRVPADQTATQWSASQPGRWQPPPSRPRGPRRFIAQRSAEARAVDSVKHAPAGEGRAVVRKVRAAGEAFPDDRPRGLDTARSINPVSSPSPGKSPCRWSTRAGVLGQQTRERCVVCTAPPARGRSASSEPGCRRSAGPAGRWMRTSLLQGRLHP